MIVFWLLVGICSSINTYTPVVMYFPNFHLSSVVRKDMLKKIGHHNILPYLSDRKHGQTAAVGGAPDYIARLFLQR